MIKQGLIKFNSKSNFLTNGKAILKGPDHLVTNRETDFLTNSKAIQYIRFLTNRKTAFPTDKKQLFYLKTAVTVR